MNRNNLAVLFATGTMLTFGCQSSNHPWAGEPYKAPSSRSNPPQSTYAPMPSILPSLDASSLVTEMPDAAATETNKPGGF